jgi:peptidoglycan/LPS O-acetylase OafA/YrhL
MIKKLRNMHWRQILEQTFELSTRPDRSRPLEGVRGLAVLLVFYVHFHTFFAQYLGIAKLDTGLGGFFWVIGHAGVDLFFVLSGYLIYGLTLQRRTAYGPFLRRRLQRLYPAFTFVFVLYVILSYTFPQYSKIPQEPEKAFLYLAQNFALLPGVFDIKPMIIVAWSLSYELVFYLTIPGLVWFTGMHRWTRRARCTCFLSLVVLYSAYSIWDGPRYLDAGFLAFAPAVHLRALLFLCGMLVYEAVHSEFFRARLSRRGETAAIAGFVASLAVLYFVELEAEELGWWYSVNRATVLGAGFFGFTVYALCFSGLLSKVLAWTPLRWLGNLSYSFYLIHALSIRAIALAFTAVLTPQKGMWAVYWAGMFAAFAGSFASATILFVLIERPYSLAKSGSVGAATR